jgi:hypothetical protein
MSVVERKVNRSLFVRHGHPMRFYIAPTNAERVSLAPLIETYGGILLKSWAHGACCVS